VSVRNGKMSWATVGEPVTTKRHFFYGTPFLSSFLLDQSQSQAISRSERIGCLSYLIAMTVDLETESCCLYPFSIFLLESDRTQIYVVLMNRKVVTWFLDGLCPLPPGRDRNWRSNEYKHC
jgi:hypothetical protein